MFTKNCSKLEGNIANSYKISAHFQALGFVLNN